MLSMMNISAAEEGLTLAWMSHLCAALQAQMARAEPLLQLPLVLTALVSRNLGRGRSCIRAVSLRPLSCCSHVDDLLANDPSHRFC